MSVELGGLLFTGVGMLILVVIALRAERRARLVVPRQQSDEERITILEEKLYYLQDEDIRKGRMIAQLQEELAAARERIRFLESQQVLKPVMAVIADQPLMVIVGNDPKLLVDLAVLRGVRGLEVTRLLPATHHTLKTTIERFRRQGKPIELAHFSVHAKADGIELDRVIAPVELSEMLKDVRVAVFMGCLTSEIGDLLAVIPSVVAFREPVPHDEAWQFSLLFWKAIGEGLTPAQAVKRAKDRGPTAIGEYVDLIEL